MGLAKATAVVGVVSQPIPHSWAGLAKATAVVGVVSQPIPHSGAG